jgi:hypothetical protein
LKIWQPTKEKTEKGRKALIESSSSDLEIYLRGHTLLIGIENRIVAFIDIPSSISCEIRIKNSGQVLIFEEIQKLTKIFFMKWTFS